jgi:uncharacterized 2Fe-2S/4Fe-4S cluster protein (DUF4445 family)
MTGEETLSRKFKVAFLPSKKSIAVHEGTSIVDAAARAGILIDTPCGGQGRCGRCLVKVEKGHVSDYESPYLTIKQIQQGWVLSCVAKVASDLVISIPSKIEQINLASEIATSRKAIATRLNWPLSPAVHQSFVELPPPNLTDNAADFDRLKSALATEYGLKNLTMDLSLMQKLSQSLRKANWRVTVVTDARNQDGEARLINIYPGHRKQPPLGVALDIGTTNVVAHLVDLSTGRSLNRISAPNKQIACGEDVISRIIYSERRGGVKQLNRLIIQTINELLEELARKNDLKTTDIDTMVVAGNTVMTHLFLALPPSYIRQEPYIPTTIQFPLVTAGELGVKLNPHALVYCIPSIAAYIGGDITAGVLSSRLFQSSKLSLFLDIGTNGEIVLGNSDWMIGCACSAGPAFEGAGIGCGMPAGTGAIEDVTINSDTLEPTIKVIGDILPLGICGSGMISALAEMLNTGIVDKAGHILLEAVSHQPSAISNPRIRPGEHGAEYVLCWASDSGTDKDIVLTEVDINNLIRTKAAIYAGITVMLKKLGISPSDIEQLLIGGAFGQHINIERAIQIGLLPNLPWEKFQFLGNTSVSGAFNVLLAEQAQRQAENIAHKITYLELIADNAFMNELTAASFLPHTDSSNFPQICSAGARPPQSSKM